MGREFRARGGWTVEQTERDGEPFYFLSQHDTVIGPDGYSLERLQKALGKYGMDFDDFEEYDEGCE